MIPIDLMLHRLLTGLSLLLEPVDAFLQALGFTLRGWLGWLGVPAGWHGPLIAAAWVLLLVLVLRQLWDWWRVAAALVAGAVALKVYGGLPDV